MYRRFSLHAAVLFIVCVALILPDASASYPAPGRDEFKSAAVIEVDLATIGGPRFSLTVVGPTQIVRFEVVDPGDGRKMVPAEIISMDLRGSTPLGAIEVRERADRQSFGYIRQLTPGEDFPAESRFYVFVEIETPLGTFRNDEPICLMATINAIPPFQAQYMPESTFEGVDLLNFDGEKVGVIRHAVHFVGQRPSFSVAPSVPPDGPSSLHPADVFDIPRAGPKLLHTTGLGLQSNDNVDGLSYGIDFIAQMMELRFSVDPDARGRVGSHVRREADKSPPEAHGDEFWTSPANFNSNAQELDENGDTAPPFPLVVSDDVDALTEPPTSFVDANGDGIPENPVFFSLGEGSGSLSPLSATPGDILRTVSGGPPEIFISHTALGLDPGDDVDAFCLVEPTRTVLFSLAPGSPTLMTGGFSPADLFLVSNAQDSQPPATPFRFVRATILGLLEADNLNALKCTVVEVDYLFSAMRAELSDEEEPITLFGFTKTLVGKGPEGQARTSSNPQTGQPVDLVSLELVILRMLGLTADEVPVSASLPRPIMSPEDVADGQIQDRPSEVTAQNVPGRLDTEPWGNGEANFFQNLPLVIRRGDQTLRTSRRVPLLGVVSAVPPAPGEGLVQLTPQATLQETPQIWSGAVNPVLENPASGDQKNQQAGIELLDENGDPTGIFISNVAFFPNLPFAVPRIAPAGIVSAASFAQGAAPEAIMSLFGSNLADSTEVATETPLPTELAGTTVMVTDAEGNQGVAALLADDAVAQAAGLAQLFFVSPAQINFLMPAGLAPGLATVTVTDDDGNHASMVVLIQNVAPALFSADASGSGVAAASFLRVAADDTRTQGLLFDPETRDAVPVDLSPEGDQVFLLLFGTGIRSFTSGVTATVDGQDTPVLGAVPQGEFVGLDQVNIGPLSVSLIGAGEVEIVLTVDGKQSNAVTVAIQ